MYQFLKPLLFQISPEKAHHLTVKSLAFTLKMPIGAQLFKASYQFEHPNLAKKVFGLNFPNPVGLAAGFDKDGKYYHDMSALGFGFMELGTVTPLGQAGNPQPRLFRLPQDKALINRMGFNNEGVDALVSRLQAKGRPGNTLIGGNIGKNKQTPNEEAVNDYLICFEKLFSYVDYFVVNVSSPNTPNLRALQDKAPLTHLLTELKKLNQKLSNAEAKRPDISNKEIPLGSMDWKKPILLKIAPDLTDGQLDDIIDIVNTTAIDGIIATNTTIAREPLSTATEEVKAIGNGGLSGAPVRSRSTEVIKYLYEKSGGSIDIIGVGGIDSPEAALEKLEAGAKVVQVYSGMIYAGPGLVKNINKAILTK